VREKVLRYVREHALLRAGDRVAVAVSGGADSVALLRLLLELRTELGVVLAVAHFNHGLRGEESDADEAFAADLARAYELDFFATHGNVRDHARTSKLSIEAAGRELRYRWFAQLAQEQRLDAIATAHTLDDQAETVLLKFLRGAGTKGLAGIYPVVPLRRFLPEAEKLTSRELDQEGKRAGGKTEVSPGREPWVGWENKPEPPSGGAVRVVRPLLCVTREDVEGYLKSLGQHWREDASNLDRRFLRNRVRHELLPLLEREYNPKLRRRLGDAAETSRAEEEYWQALVEREIVARSGGDQLRLAGFAQLPVALQRRMLKRFAELHRMTLDFEHIEELRRCAVGKLKRTELLRGVVVVRTKEHLELRSPSSQAAAAYEIVLPVPGEVRLAELGLTVRVTIVSEEQARELPQTELLERNLIGPALVLRNWRPGDRFWPEHRRSEEKLKRWFAEKHIPTELRSTWPVAFHQDKIVWVRGFPVAKAYRWKGESNAVRIQTTSDAS